MLAYLLPFFLLSSCLFAETAARPKVLVSVAPYRYFVSQIAKDFVEVNLMVPEASSAHTFEPTAKQMISAAQAEIWFRIGEPFETKAINAIQSVQSQLKIVDLREGISLIHGQCKHAHGAHCGDDLHLWLSPKIAKIQAQIIAKALNENFPQHKDAFNAHLEEFMQQLSSLDSYLGATLAPLPNRNIIVSHPAYAYFCREYNLNQISIEFEGRDPTAKQLTTLLDTAKNAQAHFILTQPQYSDKAARLIAGQIDAKLISVDPYSENYDLTLRSIAKVIAENQ